MKPNVFWNQFLYIHPTKLKIKKNPKENTIKVLHKKTTTEQSGKKGKLRTLIKD